MAAAAAGSGSEPKRTQREYLRDVSTLMGERTADRYVTSKDNLTGLVEEFFLMQGSHNHFRITSQSLGEKVGEFAAACDATNAFMTEITGLSLEELQTKQEGIGRALADLKEIKDPAVPEIHARRIEDLEKKQVALKAYIEKYQPLHDSLETAYVKLATLEAKSKQRGEAFEAEKARLEGAIAGIQVELVASKEQAEDLGAQLEAKEDVRAALEASLVEKEQELAASQAEHVGCAGTLEEKKQELGGEIARLQKEVETHREEIQTLEKRVSALNQEGFDLPGVEQKLKEAHEAHDECVERAKVTEEGLEEQIADLQAKLQALGAENAQLVTDKEALTLEKDNAEKQASQLGAEILGHKQARGRQEEELRQAADRERQVRAALAVLEGEKATLTTRVGVLETVVDAEVREKAAALDAVIAALFPDAVPADILATLAQRVTNLRTEHGAALVDIGVSEHARDAAQAGLAAAAGERDTARVDLATAVGERDIARGERDAAQAAVGVAEGARDEAQRALGALQRKVATFWGLAGESASWAGSWPGYVWDAMKS